MRSRSHTKKRTAAAPAPDPIHLDTPDEVLVWAQTLNAALSLANSAHENMVDKAARLADHAVVLFRERTDPTATPADAPMAIPPEPPMSESSTPPSTTTPEVIQ